MLSCAIAALSMPLGLPAQPTKSKIYRLGWLSGAAPTDSPEIFDAFRQTLREQGYAEGKNLIIDLRYSAGRNERYPALAAELIALKPDCVVAVGFSPIKTMKEATRTIPIIMGNVDADPVAEGLIASFARPGGNITGVTGIQWELAGKRLELLKEVYPRLSRVALMVDPRSPATQAHVKEVLAAARKLNLHVQTLEIKAPEEMESAFQAARHGGADGLFVVSTSLLSVHAERASTLAARTRLPAVYSHTNAVVKGGLMSYAPDPSEQYRRVAEYVSRIFKGARPADLPVEQQARFQLVVNMKTAKAIGVQIPKSVLSRSDRVIE